MTRKLLGLALLLAFLATPLAAEAQQPGKVYTLGLLSPNPRPEPGRHPVVNKLRELGWLEGQNLVIEWAYGEGRDDRLPELAEMLARRRVDVIWANGPTSAVAAARATKTIPIVFWGVGLPVELGLISSIARPRGNATGAAMGPGTEILEKQFEFLKHIAPGTTRIAWITNPDVTRTVSGGPWSVPFSILDDPARHFGMELRRFPVQRGEDFDGAFAAAANWRAQAVGVAGSALLWRERKRIVEFANRNRLPSTFGMRDFVEVGGLLSYAPNIPETVLRSAVYVDNLRSCLDSWRGIGAISVGMHRQGYDLQLTQYDERGWRATFYVMGIEHSLTSDTASAWEPTPWRAVQVAARDALRKAERGT